MIGIIIVTHCRLGEALIEAAESILESRPERLEFISIDISHEVEKLRAKIADGIKQVDQKDGVLILTDMFGGTPSNISYSFLEEGRIEVLSGVNLPVLIKALHLRKDTELTKLVGILETYGKKSISLASGVLKGNQQIK